MRAPAHHPCRCPMPAVTPPGAHDVGPLRPSSRPPPTRQLPVPPHPASQALRVQMLPPNSPLSFSHFALPAGHRASTAGRTEGQGSAHGTRAAPATAQRCARTTPRCFRIASCVTGACMCGQRPPRRCPAASRGRSRALPGGARLQLAMLLAHMPSSPAWASLPPPLWRGAALAYRRFLGLLLGRGDGRARALPVAPVDTWRLKVSTDWVWTTVRKLAAPWIPPPPL